MFEATVETKKRISVANFFVTPGNPGCLLNAKTAQALELISFHVCPIKSYDDSQLSATKRPDRPKKGKHAVSHAQPKKVNIQPLDPASQSKIVGQSPVSDSSLRELPKKYDKTMQGN